MDIKELVKHYEELVKKDWEREDQALRDARGQEDLALAQKRQTEDAETAAKRTDITASIANFSQGG